MDQQTPPSSPGPNMAPMGGMPPSPPASPADPTYRAGGRQAGQTGGPASRAGGPTAPDETTNRVLAGIGYLIPLVGLILLFVKKDSAFVQFHAKQATVLLVVGVILIFLPIIGWFLNLLLWLILIVAAVRAFVGNWWKIPGVSTLAEKIKV